MYDEKLRLQWFFSCLTNQAPGTEMTKWDLSVKLPDHSWPVMDKTLHPIGKNILTKSHHLFNHPRKWWSKEIRYHKNLINVISKVNSRLRHYRHPFIRHPTSFTHPSAVKFVPRDPGPPGIIQALEWNFKRYTKFREILVVEEDDDDDDDDDDGWWWWLMMMVGDDG